MIYCNAKPQFPSIIREVKNMAGVTYKCPSCGAYLTFRPDSGKWACDFCGAEFGESELTAKAEKYEQEAEKEAARDTQDAQEGEEVVYHCPSCGSEIMTDATTVATSCYYCHNPVVLQGKLTKDMKPDQVLPFAIGKDKAVERFMSWVSKKRFVPKGFFSKDRVESMSGVYYPHFVSTCEVEGDYQGEGRNISVADTPKYIVTTTQHFAVRRKGILTFKNIMRPALKATDRKLSDGIHPFPLDDVEDFSSAYLSGFLAERRDMTKQEATSDVESEVDRYVEPLLTADTHYDSESGSAQTVLRSIESKYVLLPTWVLTYNKHGEKEPYYYVMNGRTGSVCGKLPIDKGKLAGFSAIIGALAAAVCAVILYFVAF